MAITKIQTNSLADGAVTVGKANFDGEVVDDGSPQLGAPLDVNGNEITSSGNNHVVINPNGTGLIKLNASTTIEDGAHDFDIASHDTSNGLKLGGTLVTATAAELNKVDGYTGSATDLNKIAGYTGTAAELNVLDLNANEIVGVFKVATSVPTQASDFTGNVKIIMVY